MKKYLIIGGGALAVLIIVLVVSSFFGSDADPREGEQIPVALWGPFPFGALRPIISELNAGELGFFLSYTERPAETYEQDVIGALAAGEGPDLWFVNAEILTRNRGKTLTIPFSSVSERFYLDTFADGAEGFIDRAGGGIAALPILIDPITLYWNKTLFSSAGIAAPPATWNQFLTDAQAITRRKGSTIAIAGAALGEYRNVAHASDILSMLMIQLGNPIIDTVGGVVLGASNGDLIGRAANALDFYTEFSDPAKPAYAWNRSLADSTAVFSGGLLGMYLGYGSEVGALRARNPHISFDVAIAPQVLNGSRTASYARFHGIAISTVSAEKAAAARAAFALVEPDKVSLLADGLGMAPARRDLLAVGSRDAVASVIYRSAVFARTWLEPDPDRVDTIFREMVESVATGRATSRDAVSAASEALRALTR